MKSLVDNKIIGTPVMQNKQDFVIGVFTISQIFKFTRYTHRLIIDYDEDNEPVYNKHIQREVEEPRVQKIADFLIHDPEATFPTNIVLHIPRQVILKQTEERDRLIIHLNDKLFDEVRKDKGHVFISIIDGQHRIRGIEVGIERLRQHIDSLTKTISTGSTKELLNRLEYYQDRLNDLLNIEVVVSFFIDKTLEYQAMIFSTINRTQKRVSPSLVSSLFGLDTRDTPQKTALQVVLTLNGHKKSPFYKRVKLYGGDYDQESPPLSQATMVRSIVNLISENIRESENDRFKERKDLRSRTLGSNKFLPFRKFYAANHDNLISDTLFYYFTAVEEVFHDRNGRPYWHLELEDKIENIFQSTVGYDTLLKILVEIIEAHPTDYETALLASKANKLDFFVGYLKRASGLRIGDITRYSLNNRGKRILYLDLSLKIFPPDKHNKKDSREEELAELLKTH